MFLLPITPFVLTLLGHSSKTFPLRVQIIREREQEKKGSGYCRRKIQHFIVSVRQWHNNTLAAILACSNKTSRG